MGARRQLKEIIRQEKYFGKEKIITNQKSEVFLRWWAIGSNENNKITKDFELCLKDNRWPFNFTMNGQTQGYAGAHLLDSIELSWLRKHFICEVDLTNITKQERRSIFSSSRENISEDSEFWNEIWKKISKSLKNSSKVQTINKEIKEALNIPTSEENKFSLTKWIQKIFPQFDVLFSKGSVATKSELENLKKREKDREDREQHKSNNDMKLQDWPSYFRFKGRQPLEFSDKNLKIKYETDGKPDVILNAIEITNMHSSLKLKDKQQNGGNGFILFDASKTPINKEIIISFNILQGTFKENVKIRKIEKQLKKLPKIEIVIVKKESEKIYANLEFNKDKPCVPWYNKEKNKLTIHINFATYAYIGKYLKKIDDMQKQFIDHYKKGLTMYIVSQIKEEKNYKFNEDYDYNPIAKSLICTFMDAKIMLMKRKK